MKIFYVNIDENLEQSGMQAISLVDDPAVLKNFLCFSNEEKQKQLLFSNDEKHIISGVVCLCDTPIYRYDDEIGDYYIVFTNDVIEKMVLKYNRDGKLNNVDLQHNGELVSGITMLESYIKDEKRGISPIEFKDVTDGSWICSFKVSNEELWNEIKTSGKLNGFSLAGLFDLSRFKVTPKKTDKYTEMNNLIDEILNKN